MVGLDYPRSTLFLITRKTQLDLYRELYLGWEV
jgi:hypothetical protein